jgi:hypothetical protein
MSFGVRKPTTKKFMHQVLEPWLTLSHLLYLQIVWPSLLNTEQIRVWTKIGGGN